MFQDLFDVLSWHVILETTNKYNACAGDPIGALAAKVCWDIRTHVKRPHRLSKPTPEPLGQIVFWHCRSCFAQDGPQHLQHFFSRIGFAGSSRPVRPMRKTSRYASDCGGLEIRSCMSPSWHALSKKKVWRSRASSDPSEGMTSIPSRILQCLPSRIL
jgi:hypothetical protein